MWTDGTIIAEGRLLPIQDNEQYIAPNGTTYPRNFPKDEIAELFPVTLAAQPENTVLLSSSIEPDGNGGYIQVLETRPMTQEEIDAANNYVP